MPLLDHFHPPLEKVWPWEGIHSDWASSVARQLNRKLLPEQYLALPRVYFGGRIEIDVATVKRDGNSAASEGGGVATATWAPARPTLDVAVDFVDLGSVEVQVFDDEGGRRLVAAVELVSPANKDRQSHREAFVYKCAAYPQEGVSLLIVDVVSARRPNLHRELLELLELASEPNGREFPDLYAVSYRTFTVARKGRLQVWEEPLGVGKALPVVPLWISPEQAVPLDLEASYQETCEGLRILPRARE